MVASRGRDHAPFFLVGRQLDKGVARASFLKTARALQVVELAENFHARGLAQRDRRPAGRIVNRVGDAVARRFDVFERDHALFNIPRTQQRQCSHVDQKIVARQDRPMAVALWATPRACVCNPCAALAAAIVYSLSSASRTLAASCSESNGFGKKNMPGSRRSPGWSDSSRYPETKTTFICGLADRSQSAKRRPLICGMTMSVSKR